MKKVAYLIFALGILFIAYVIFFAPHRKSAARRERDHFRLETDRAGLVIPDRTTNLTSV